MKYFNVLIFAFIVGSCAKPIANFSYVEKKRVAPVEVRFENLSSNATEYEWSFGDDSISYEKTPMHRFITSGNYLVTLKAKKGNKTQVFEKRIFVAAPETCLVELETAFGKMLIQLYDATPKHRDNFVKLVEEGFYDGLIFHRVIDGFMLQGGDPDSKGASLEKQVGNGGPGYRIPAEFVDSLIHIKGAVAAARTPNPKKESSGSQFYIVQGRPVSKESLEKAGVAYSKQQIEAYSKWGGSPQLDQEYTVFGRVIKGLEVIDEITKVQTNKIDRPLKNVVMKIRIIN